MSVELVEQPVLAAAVTENPPEAGLGTCFYVGAVRHLRRRPAAHRFSFPLFMTLVDLDEIDRIFRVPLFCSTGPLSVVRFRRADYLGDPACSIRGAVRELVRKRTGITSIGPIRLLTNLRFFGFGFNPVSFYFCYDADGDTLRAVVADVTNTPWQERHAYVIPCDPDTESQAHECDKVFHVSPFMQMSMRYRWQFGAPGEQLSVRIENHDSDGVVFAAELALRRQKFSYTRLLWLLIRFPVLTLRIGLAIYWHAFRLWRKRVPFVPHPRTQEAIDQ